ncbi:unnamed protein product [Schistosoma intercalatum]|nr:unnamed protein product [Schistosoma intercalatum]
MIIEASILGAILVKLIPLWLLQDDFDPFLYIGTISDCDRSGGITSNSHILAKILVNLIAKIGPPSLKTSGTNPSGPAAFLRFILTIACIAHHCSRSFIKLLVNLDLICFRSLSCSEPDVMSLGGTKYICATQISFDV